MLSFIFIIIIICTRLPCTGGECTFAHPSLGFSGRPHILDACEYNFVAVCCATFCTFSFALQNHFNHCSAKLFFSSLSLQHTKIAKGSRKISDFCLFRCLPVAGADELLPYLLHLLLLLLLAMATTVVLEGHAARHRSAAVLVA